MKKILLLGFNLLFLTITIFAQKYPFSADSIAKQYVNFDSSGCSIYALDEEFATIYTTNLEILEIDFSSYTYYVNFSRSTQHDFYIVIGSVNYEIMEVHPNDKSLPWQLKDWRMLVNDTTEIIVPDTAEFCNLFREDNLDTILPIINGFLETLSSSLTDTQKIEMTAMFLRQFKCLDSVIVQGVNNVRPWMPGTSPVMSEIVVYWKEQGIQKHMVFDIVMKNLLTCGGYHRNYTKRDVAVKFDPSLKFKDVCSVLDTICNPPDFSMKKMYNSTYYSAMICDSLGMILDSLKLISYINYGWATTGYCHYLTNQITIFPDFGYILDKNNQADWLRVMTRFQLSESGGYIVYFLVPEGVEEYWVQRFASYSFVTWAELNGIHHM